MCTCTHTHTHEQIDRLMDLRRVMSVPCTCACICTHSRIREWTRKKYGFARMQGRVHVHHVYITHTHVHTYMNAQKEVWIRAHAVSVLVFEGIVTGVLGYDYSSSAVTIGEHVRTIYIYI
jgi:hypothetical protein